MNTAKQSAKRTAIKLETILDLNHQCVNWRLEDNELVYSCLQDLLTENELVFSPDSMAIVTLIQQSDEEPLLATLVYRVSYDPCTDTISLKGLLGDYQGSVFETFMRFGQEHFDFANIYGARAEFTRDYKAYRA